MDNNQVTDMNDDIPKFCVSFVSIQVASFHLETVAASWIEHIIPGNKCFLFVLIYVVFKQHIKISISCSFT